MLQRYKWRFILLNMCIVGVMLMLVFIFISVYMYHNYYDMLESTMTEIVKPMSRTSASAEEPADTETPTGDNGEASDTASDSSASSGRRAQATTSSLAPEERKGINTIFYDKESGKITVLSRTPIFSSDMIAQAVPEITAQDDSFGTLRAYGMIYYYSGGNGDSYKIAVTRIGYIWEEMVQFIFLLTGTYIFVMVLFYFISRRFAEFAAQPMEESIAREKRFIADVSHDLKTPLTVIMANISVLQRNPAASADDQMKWIESTQQAARNMRTMVNELLTLSSVESANTVIHLTAVDFSSAVECSALQMESVAYDRGIVLETHIQKGLWIRADQEYLQRVINSLIENALKYEPDGGSLSVCLTAEKGQAVFAVSNPHSVISQEDLPHIFERFYRANKTRTEDGHGLGLAIAKSMTEAMGGTLSARSSTDAGTCFTLRLRHL